MRHRKKTTKLGRTAEHRNALLANQTCSLIEHGRIKTTLAKAKAVRPMAEKMVTLAKRGGLHARRRALALLHNNSTRTVKAVGKLFSEIAPGAPTAMAAIRASSSSGPGPATPLRWPSSNGSISPAADTANPKRKARRRPRLRKTGEVVQREVSPGFRERTCEGGRLTVRLLLSEERYVTQPSSPALI